jgi:predicted nucleic acid-binding protein
MGRGLTVGLSLAVALVLGVGAVAAEPESEGALELALLLYEENSADYSDCVHVALAAQPGEQPMWTFDKATAKLDGAKLLV